MIYDAARKRWNLDNNASGNVVAAPAPAPASAPSPSGDQIPDIEAALAGLTRQFGTTVTALSAVAAKLKNP